MSRIGKNITFQNVRQAEIQISLRVSPVWPDYLLGAYGIAKYTKRLYADNVDSNQIARMRSWFEYLMGAYMRWYISSPLTLWFPKH